MPFYDVSTRALRSALKPREKVYWHRIAANHHVGIRMTETNGASWVSRVRADTSCYHERTLGRATLFGRNGSGIGFFGFTEALKKAAEYRVNQHKIGVAASPHSLWYDGQLIICPVGDVITVGHALHHFIEWRRISAAHSTFRSNLSMVNYHLVPRIGTITLTDFNGEHFQALCRDVLETPPKKREPATEAETAHRRAHRRGTPQAQKDAQRTYQHAAHRVHVGMGSR